jgi:uncharacterized protein (TIGR03085 family)
MPWAETEKEALAGTLSVTDPDAATLCEGWTARHLLAHLVQREQHPLGSIGDQVSRRPPGQEKHLGRLVTQVGDEDGYQVLLRRFLAGPPRWSPMSWAADPLNFLEYVIHHEDIRRGGTTPERPRVLPQKEVESIWQRLLRFAPLSFRRSPVGVTLARPGGTSRRVKKGHDGVVVTGEPVELLLYISGRERAAQVEVSGTADAVARFQSWRGES